MQNDTTVWKNVSAYQGSQYVSYPESVQCKLYDWETCFFESNIPLVNGKGQKSVERCTDYSVSRIQGTIIFVDAKNRTKKSVTDSTKPTANSGISITMDNWQDYFEFVEKANPRKNAFDETESLSYDYYFCLKSKNIDNNAKIDIVVEYSYTAKEWEYEIDADKKSIKLLKPCKYQTPYYTENIVSEIHSSEEQVIIGQYFPPDNTEVKLRVVKCTDFVVMRIKGTIS